MRWKSIKYSEEKGIFDKLIGKSKDYFGGEFMDPYIYMVDAEDFGDFYVEDRKIPISFLYLSPDELNNYFDIYIRNRKEITDILANMFSLSLAFYNGFIFVFCGFYSNNFDNYKIIENIFSKYGKKDLKKKNDKNKLDHIENEENEIDNDNMIELNNYNNNIDKKEDNLLNKKNNENIIIDEKEKEKENDVLESENEAILPRLHFYHYFFNNIYLKKCCASNNQDIISTCNDIISKYYSIDNILYNQLLLENLFKDYKWNDPKLNTIENIKLVKDLNLLINN